MTLELRRRNDSTRLRTNHSLNNTAAAVCAAGISCRDAAMQKQSDATGEPHGSPLQFMRAWEP